MSQGRKNKSLGRHKRFAVIAAAVAFSGAAAGVQAQTRTWDGGGSNDNWTTNNNWDNNGAPESTANVIFGSGFGSGTSIDLGGNRTVNSFTINTTTGFSISGGDTLTLTSGQFTRNDVAGTENSHTFQNNITLGAAGVFNINGSGTLTIDGAIGDGSSTFSLTKSGAGVLILSGSSESYNGDTIVNGGVLRLGASNQIASGSGFGNLVVNNGGTFDIASSSDTVNGLLGDGIVDKSTSGSATLTVGDNNASATFSGTITDTSGTLNLTKTGTGTQVLSGTNSYSGTTSIAGGVLRIDAAASLGSGNLSLNGGVLGLAAGDFTRALGTGSNQVQWSGAGGFAAYGADRTVNLGGAGATLSTGSGTFFGDSSSDELILGATDSAHTLTFANGINFDNGSSNRNIRVENGSANVDAIITGNIQGNTTGWDKEGAGTLRLTGSNTYSLTTNVNAGKLLVDGTHTSSGTTDDYTVAAGATLGGGGTISIGNNNITLSGTSGNRAVLNPGGGAAGDTIATLSVTGNVIFSGNSRYAVEVNGGSADRLSITGNLDLDNFTTEDLAINATSPTLGKYTLVSYTGSLAGSQSFSTVSGVPTNYRVINNTAGKSIDLQHKADQTLTASAPSSPIDALVGQTIGFAGSLNNTAIADSSDLVAALSSTGGLSITGLSGSNATAGGSSAVSGTINTGATAGAGKTWQVTNTDANAVSTTASTSGVINVYDHASGSISGSSLIIPTVIVGYSDPVDSTGALNVSNALGYRVDLKTTNNGPIGSIALGNALGVDAGANQAIGAQLLAGKGVGSFSQDIMLTYADDTSLGGASSNLGTSNVNVSGTVLAHSNGSFSGVADTDTLLIDFGSVVEGSGGGMLSQGFDIHNLIAGSNPTAGLDLDSFGETSDASNKFSTANLATFVNLLAGTSNGSGATINFDTTTAGIFSATYTFWLSDQDLPGATGGQSLTLNVVGEVTSAVPVPEPTGLALLGVAAAGLLARRRRVR